MSGDESRCSRRREQPHVVGDDDLEFRTDRQRTGEVERVETPEDGWDHVGRFVEQSAIEGDEVQLSHKIPGCGYCACVEAAGRPDDFGAYQLTADEWARTVLRKPGLECCAFRLVEEQLQQCR